MSKALISSNAQGSGMKNRIINGGMDISQRGTSFASPANGSYTLDRWGVYYVNDGAITITQNSDAPTNNEFQNSLRVTVNTSDTSIAAGQYSVISQTIEGYNVRDLIGRTFTVSFWVRSSKTGIHCFRMCNIGADRSYIVEYTITVADTWQYKTVTITGGLPTAGTWNYTNSEGLYITFSLAVGSTFQTTAGTWNTGNFLGTSNQVNCLDLAGNIFAITGVQLEVGAVATPFEHRLYGAELALCQRYYWRYAPGFISAYIAPVSVTTTTNCSAYFSLPVPMRSVPALEQSGTASDYAVVVSNVITALTSMVLSSITYSTSYIKLVPVVSGGLTAGQSGELRLSASVSTGYISFSAEL